MNLCFNFLKRRVDFLKRRIISPKRRIILSPLCFVLLLFCISPLYSQKNDILSYDECSESISKSAKNDFGKAFSAYKKGEYNKSVAILKELIDQESDFASAYFLLGIIGVSSDKPTMIEKYMSKVYEICPEFSHPLLYYYLGVIEYSNNNYGKAIPHFEQFFAINNEDQYENLQNEAINYIQWCDFLHETTEKNFPFTPQKIDGVSSSKDESNIFISHDQQQIFFVRKEMLKQENDESFYRKTEFKQADVLCRSEIDQEGMFDVGFRIDKSMKMSEPYGKVSLSCNNKILYFSQMNKQNGENSLDIFVCENIGGYWSEPKLLSESVNKTTSNEISPSVSCDGNTLYFASNRDGGNGGYDIYVCRKEKDGTWSEASNMGKRINSPGDEMNPFIHSDNHSFYFSSNGWKTIGGNDCFYIDLDDIKMKKARNIGANINTENDEMEIGVLADGKTAYGTYIDSHTNNKDICLFPLPDDVCAEKTALLKGRIDTKTEQDYECSIKSYAKKRRTSVTYRSDAETGEFVLSLIDKEEYLLKIEKQGYEFCAFYVDLNDTISGLDLTLSQLVSGESYVLRDIIFDSSNQIREDSREILNEFVVFLKENPRLRIEIFAPSNKAAIIADYIIKSGIRADRIAVSKRETEEIGYILQ